MILQNFLTYERVFRVFMKKMCLSLYHRNRLCLPLNAGSQLLMVSSRSTSVVELVQLSFAILDIFLVFVRNFLLLIAQFEEVWVRIPTTSGLKWFELTTSTYLQKIFLNSKLQISDVDLDLQLNAICVKIYFFTFRPNIQSNFISNIFIFISI